MVDPININSIGPIKGLEGTGSAKESGGIEGPSFSEVLKKSLEEVNNMQHVAGEMTTKYATGEIDNLADVMVAVEEANLAFNATMQIRNKILEAYQELTRMQV
jgi:flagellar hook-basal body complex protein FliE